MGFGSIGRIVADVATGGLAEPLLFMPQDAAKKNAASQRDAAAAATSATVQAAKIAADAQQKALETQIAAQKEGTAAAVAAAEKARQEAIAAVEEANKVAEQASRAGADFSNKEFSAAYDTIKNNLTPWVQQGQQATNQLSNMVGLNGAEAAKNAMTTDPSYQWRVDQGQKAVERSAIGQGNLFSGNTGIALQEYGQNMGSQEFQNAFNRLMTLSTQGLGATNAQSGYDWNMAGVKSGNEKDVQNTVSNNAMNLANTKSTGSWNVAKATGEGAQNIANTTIQGAQQGANVANQNAWNVANAQGNQAYANAGADMMQNNALPNAINNALNLGVSAAGMMYGMPRVPTNTGSLYGGNAMNTGQTPNYGYTNYMG